ncbi:MAG: protein kinase, partial [Pyrinomonadaceae bacterium]
MKPLAQNTLIQNRYLVVHLIGKGGMGEVYLAVDQRLGSAVALKRTFFAGDETLGNAFEREAKTLARMRHPVLPKVSDHFSENEEQYLVMEHIAGDDLSKRLEMAKKPFPASWVLFWADQLLDALSYLHSNEPPIIHRDIKPQNLKLTDENHVILLDFGLSKTSTGQTHLTPTTGSTGSVVGYTPHYAPMEQIRGIGTSARSDLYSLSATLYQLLTNVVPPDALTRADIILNGSPDPLQPLETLNPEIPVAVGEIIRRGMEVSQDKRFATAREMQKGLRRTFNDMQEAMSAQTVAFNIGSEAIAATASPPIPFETRTDHPSDLRGISSPSRPKNESPEIAAPQQEFDPVGAYPPGGNFANVERTPVETGLFSPPTDVNSQPRADYNSRPESAFDSEIADNFSSLPSPSEIPATDFDETMPSSAGNSGGSFRHSPAAAIAAPFTVPIGDSSTDSSRTGTSNPSLPRSAAAGTPRGSSKKAFAVFGGVAAFFMLVLGAGAAGWYIYNNYYSASAVPEATPSPTVVIQAKPTVAPTLESPPEQEMTVEKPRERDDAESEESTSAPASSPVSREDPPRTANDASSRPQQNSGSRPSSARQAPSQQ